MLDKETAKEKIKAIIEHYHKQKEIYDKASEQDIRLKLIDKIFKTLGWDLDGDENPDEVFREEGIKDKESKKKKADYVFRLNGVPKFVVEAKAIKGVDMDNEEFRKQAIEYAYNLACSWAVLTNFARTTIFFVDRNDDTPIRDIKNLTDLANFDKNFESLWFLSKEGIKDELLEKDVELRGIKPQRDKVGKQLFEDLKDWRKKLSDDIKKKYHEKFKDYEIEEIVQKIIDRLIFIRKLEDLELEERKLDQLTRKFSDKTPYYAELKEIFSYYHDKYNSGLFGDNGNLQQCDLIDVGTDCIREVILGLYKPKGVKIEYNFAAIDADILGNIYEQYLSYILKDTPKKAKLEGGRAHRKEQGIYYTPTYIVDYIVKNTIREYCKHKELGDIIKIKILDPACGSGSFLIRAFSELCSIIEERLKKDEKIRERNYFDDYSENLTLSQKITIMKNCIYGVDLDKKAVEIAQLNLLLKLLEGETAESIAKLGKTKKLLPMLGENIKNGNSLIDDIVVAGDKVFKWEEKYGDIIKYDDKGNLKEGYGFDVVIGNPPYVRPEKVPREERDYYINSNKYNKMFGRFDLYVIFIEKALKINKEGGIFSFIIPSSFLNQNYSKILREWILNDFSLGRLLDLSNIKVFDTAEVQTCIPFIKKAKPVANSQIEICKLNKIVEMNNLVFINIPQKKFLTTPQCIIKTDLNDKKSEIINKLLNLPTHIKDLFYTVIGAVPHDSKTGASKDRLITTKKEGSDFKPYLEGKDVSRYIIKSRNIFLNYQPKLMHRPKFPELFENKKLIIRNISTKEGLLSTYDKDNFYTNDTVSLAVPWYLLENVNIKGENITQSMIKDSQNYDILCCLGLINSRLLNFYFKNVLSSNLHVYPEAIRNLPIKLPLKVQEAKLVSLVDKMLSLNKKLNELGDKQTEEVKQIKEQIEETDKLIDEEVYKLYGITAEEKKVIEESLK